MLTDIDLRADRVAAICLQGRIEECHMSSLFPSQLLGVGCGVVGQVSFGAACISGPVSDSYFQGARYRRSQQVE